MAAKWTKFLYPQVSSADLPPMLAVACIGAVLGGLYGIAHDQLTFSISPEYFTNMKFYQFRYADFGLGDRVFVATIGFIAVSWVGFVIAWFLARTVLPNRPRKEAYRQLAGAFLIVFAVAALAGMAAYGYGLWVGPDPDYAYWIDTLRHYRVTDAQAFIRVAYIHYAGYAGGLLGFLVALAVVRRAA